MLASSEAWPSMSHGRMPSSRSVSPAICTTLSETASRASRTPCGWMAPGTWIGSRSQLVRSAFPKSGSRSPMTTFPLCSGCASVFRANASLERGKRRSRRCSDNWCAVRVGPEPIKDADEDSPHLGRVATISIKELAAPHLAYAECGRYSAKDHLPPKRRPPSRTYIVPKASGSDAIRGRSV